VTRKRDAIIAAMTNLLKPVDLKLERAQQQVRELLHDIAAWMNSSRFALNCELREQRLGYRMMVGEFLTVPPLDNWGLRAGECFHNLRSALDNLAYALARLKKDPPDRPKSTAFPIYSDRALFEKNGRRNIVQMHADAALQVERIQPFQRDGGSTEGSPNQDPLLTLQWFNNTDKHQVPSVVLLASAEIGHGHQIEFRTEEERAANTPPDVTIDNRLVPGVILYEMRTKHPLVAVRGETQVHAVVAIETEAEAVSVDQLLPLIAGYTESIVNIFRAFFE
jgi:hypothetical protein